MNKLKGVFIPLHCYFYVGKNPPFYCFNPNTKFGISQSDVGWKDKFNSPRFESSPYFAIRLFKTYFIWYWKLPLHFNHTDYDYWEQALWYIYYNNCDIRKARDSWPWTDFTTNKSTWNYKYLTSKSNEILNGRLA